MRFYLKTQPECKVPSPSEKLTLQAIIDYCGKDRIRNSDFEPNGKTTAPDYILEDEKPDGSISKINLEVTSVFGHQMHQDTNVLRKWQPIDPVHGLRKKLNLLDWSYIREGDIITIYFLNEILFEKKSKISISKLAKPLYQKIKSLYEQNKIGNGSNFTIDSQGEAFAFYVIKSSSLQKESPRIILIQPALEFVEKEVLAYANLKHSIEDKTKKLSAIEGEKWLGIYNEDIGLDITDYIKPYHYLIIEGGVIHPFSRIFVVSGDTDSNVDPDIVELTKGYEI